MSNKQQVACNTSRNGVLLLVACWLFPGRLGLGGA